MGSLAERLRTAPRKGCLAMSLYEAATGEEIACSDSKACFECWDRVKDVLADAVEVERRKTEYDGVDVDALLKLADHLNVRMSYDPQGDNLIADTIRTAVKGAKPQLPEGIEWPRFEDGELVKFGDEFVNVHGAANTAHRIIIGKEGYVFNAGFNSKSCRKYGEPVKRPEPEVLDADGVPIKVGDTVWPVRGGKEGTVWKIVSNSVMLEDSGVVFSSGMLTHRKPDTQEAIDEDMALGSYEYLKKHGLILVKADGETKKEFKQRVRIAHRQHILGRQRKLLGGE